MNNYDEFLSKKVIKHNSDGFIISKDTLNKNLFDWQKTVVGWSLFQGRCALFEDCGLGKTIQQIEWAKHVYEHSNQNVLILTPLAVAQQTKREGLKFGVALTVCRTQSDVRPGVNIANYEMIDHFDTNGFSGIVLDESSVLKNYSGKIKNKLMAAFKNTRYKLVCSATPAPNDLMEILNQSDFLGIMPSNEALARWFINDTMSFGSYRLKKHAVSDFWNWVQSWAVWINTPSDIGYSDCGYVLPKVETIVHLIPNDKHDFSNGRLFNDCEVLNATNLYRELRNTAPKRCAKACEIVNNSYESWIIWCNTNDESQRLTRGIDGAVELTGSMDVKKKEHILEDFANGNITRLVSKPKICSFGLNWQHINHQISVGINFSFEQKYQALKRLHRFGQLNTVIDHVVISETEQQVFDIVKKKADLNNRYQSLMKCNVDQYLNPQSKMKNLRKFLGTDDMEVPTWMRLAA